jgi:hypothetical protein
MAVDGVDLIDHGKAGTTLGYWLLTLVLGQAAGVYGMFLGRMGATPSGERGSADASAGCCLPK